MSKKMWCGLATFIALVLVAFLGHAKGASDERALERTARDAQKQVTALASVPVAPGPQIDADVRTTLQEMLIQIVPAGYSALDIGVKGDFAVPGAPGECNATIGNTRVDAVVQGEYVFLKAHRQGANWTIDNTDVNLDTPPRRVRAAIETCANAIANKGAYEAKQRAEWVSARAQNGAAAAVPGTVSGGEQTGTFGSISAGTYEPLVSLPGVKPGVRKVLERMLTQIVPSQYSTLSMGDSVGTAFMLGSCKAMHSGAEVRTFVPHQIIQLAAHRQGVSWVVSSTNVDTDDAPGYVRAEIQRCVGQVISKEAFLQRNHVSWAQLASTAQ
ncbi:hypothetical protein [Paraburkholderia sp. J8-2]|uniref:hypothetical protein n=1 Tax=Paraburkholderia sp. J8-2 TaxID=2805440 RepID=UPI002AB641D9|nr:hypothetical protein [Paraburkholderia sp. J8-2]